MTNEERIARFWLETKTFEDPDAIREGYETEKYWEWAVRVQNEVQFAVEAIDALNYHRTEDRKEQT